ncbi:ribonuclease E activity regulator RraA [Pseudoduganella sp. GCM10020061]|uniref:ribonuclease E activity regulator RraA n=1 Tax=Pseudoduganella sp. GCM10020061 TaxID=3317345 RepID=UPI003627F9DE
MPFATADLCDNHPHFLASGELAILPPVFRHYGKRTRFCGRVVTLKVFEDNAIVRSALEAPGHGSVLVVDGGGSMRCALVGGNLATLAQDNGWSGVLVYGCVRDSEEIGAREVGVLALGTHPLRSSKKGEGERNARVCVAGLHIQPGDWLYADRDGTVIARHKIA